MRYIRFVAAVAATIIATPASAADAVKITFRDAMILFGALAQLNGRDRVIKDGQNERVVNEPYKFGAGLRIVIFKNIARLTPVVTVYQDTVKAMRAEVAKGKQVLTDDSPEIAELNRRNDEVLKTEEEIQPLIHIKVGELKLDENPIPVTVLAALAPIIDD